MSLIVTDTSMDECRRYLTSFSIWRRFSAPTPISDSLDCATNKKNIMLRCVSSVSSCTKTIQIIYQTLSLLSLKCKMSIFMFLNIFVGTTILESGNVVLFPKTGFKIFLFLGAVAVGEAPPVSTVRSCAPGQSTKCRQATL
jgi:hypothetical protein